MSTTRPIGDQTPQLNPTPAVHADQPVARWTWGDLGRGTYNQTLGRVVNGTCAVVNGTCAAVVNGTCAVGRGIGNTYGVAAEGSTALLAMRRARQENNAAAFIETYVRPIFGDDTAALIEQYGIEGVQAIARTIRSGDPTPLKEFISSNFNPETAENLRTVIDLTQAIRDAYTNEHGAPLPPVMEHLFKKFAICDIA